MKQTQWTIAALVLAVMVFGLTFAVNYLGGTDGPPGEEPPETRPVAAIEFPRGLAYPADGTRLEQEEHVPGHRDFWFVNPNDEAVTVGLDKTNCKCSEVEAFVLPEGPRAAEATRLVQGEALVPGDPYLSPLLAEMACEPLLAAAAGGVKGVRLKKEVASVQVPAGAVGFVRLHWTGERTGRPALEAALWMGSPGSNRDAKLQVHLTVYEPVRVRLAADEPTVLTDSDLQAGASRTIYAWSSTRRNFDLQARLSTVAPNKDADPVKVYDPVLLSDDERRALEDENSRAAAGGLDGSVLWGYRVKVQLRAVSADGKTPFPVGPFSRRVLLTSRDAGVVDKAVVVSGRVEGAVKLADSDSDAGGVNFSSFPRSAGKKRTALLECEVKGMTLEVDSQRTAKFLTASVRRDRTGRDIDRWQLTIHIPPNKARGPFPRSEEGYKDAAVYLKATEKGKPPRLVRIAVQGIAREQ